MNMYWIYRSKTFRLNDPNDVHVYKRIIPDRTSYLSKFSSEYFSTEFVVIVEKMLYTPKCLILVMPILIIFLTHKSI